MTFVPAYFVVGDPNAQKTAIILHGILGAAQNFRSFAKKLAERAPGFRFVVMDLRNHGASRPAPAPHTVAECARDLSRLAEHIRAEHGHLPQVLIGHSFGGKVCLKFLEQRGATLSQAWILDSNPGAQTPSPNNEVLRVLRAARSVPQPILKRQVAVDALLAEGLSSGIAHWMATNLKWQDDRFTWTLDFDAIEELLADYFATDLWPLLETPREQPEIHFVVAEKSDRFTPELRARSLSLPPSSHVTGHLLPASGHWVHVDNPEGLLDLFAKYLV